jgi:hypothetical protein
LGSLFITNSLIKIVSMLKKILFSVFSLLIIQTSFAQSDRWQQKAEYNMDIDMDVNTHQFTGKQSLKYYNNSPDDLNRVFYHLYFNAFQPGSMMDVRNQNLPDSDARVAGRIGVLTPEQIGFTKVFSLKQNGKDVKFEIVGTILEVELNELIKAGETATFEMEFQSQVPVQIRRSGRDNKEGISYSMAQWYPKMCEYDYQGWHANPYIGREFHGIWGDFNVNISIAGDYIIGGTGYLQNADEIGYGYAKTAAKVDVDKSKKKTWKFFAPNVHDFMWAADPDYKHTTYKRKDGVTMHFLYQPGENTDENWERLPAVMDKAFEFINKTYGKYSYKQYSFIQGGDGGMEYPMATLITGERKFSSLVGVSVHELMHSWYQMMMGTNEALYAWMDEGFTSYASSEVMNHLKREGLIPDQVPVENPHAGSTTGLARWSKSGFDEPLTTHADHFNRNQAYGVAAYVKGEVFLNELNYIVGQENFDRAMLTYYDLWKFKHPNTNDVIRVFEKQSNLELDWFKEYYVQTTKMPDYKVASVEAGKKKTTKITLEKVGLMPMPIDVEVTYKNGDKELFTIPLRIMRGAKTQDGDKTLKVLEDWPWTNATYEFEVKQKLKKVKSVVIDPSKRLLDLELEDNVWEK